MGLNLDDWRKCIQYLEQKNFGEYQRLPFIASRHWRLQWEREAWQRFRQARSNIHEVAIPKLYWWLHGMKRDSLFSSVTLGNLQHGQPSQEELNVLYCRSTLSEFDIDTSELPAKCPCWTIVPRFDRFIIRSHPSLAGRDFVYFGDDTLYLMAKSRQLLQVVREEIERDEIQCLDLCCGSGGVGLGLPPFKGSLEGLDLNPAAIAVAEMAAQAQGLKHYQYHCTDALSGMSGYYDLIFGNPPTLDPKLTGKEVFHATGGLELFASILGNCLQTLAPDGRAILTVFSVERDGIDESYELIKEIVGLKRGFLYRVRREFALEGNCRLRHSSLEFFPDSEPKEPSFSAAQGGWQLPALKWRRN